MSNPTPPPGKKPARKLSLSKLLGLILFIGAIGGGSAWFLQQRDHTAAAAKVSESSSAPKFLVQLEGFTVNLADPEEGHFLRATIVLGIDQLPVGADPEKPAKSIPVPRIRDSILSVLTVCKADELLTLQGKANLKKNILDALSKSVPELEVRDIYFTEFLVQR